MQSCTALNLIGNSIPYILFNISGYPNWPFLITCLFCYLLSARAVNFQLYPIAIWGIQPSSTPPPHFVVLAGWDCPLHFVINQNSTCRIIITSLILRWLLCQFIRQINFADCVYLFNSCRAIVFPDLHCSVRRTMSNKVRNRLMERRSHFFISPSVSPPIELHLLVLNCGTYHYHSCEFLLLA